MKQLRQREEPEAPAAPSDLDAEMARELLAHYLATADEKLSGLDKAIDEARAQPGDDGAIDRLRRALHKVAGSAGSYGFPGLSGSARALEQATVLAHKTLPVPASLLESAAAFRAEMAAEFTRALESLAPPLATDGSAAPAPAAAAEPSRAQAALSRAASAVAHAVAAARAPEPAGMPAASPPALSAVRERLVVAVICDEQSDEGMAVAAGRALAAAGTHLAGTGPDAAARGFRESGGEGLVLWIGAAPRGAVSSLVDLPLCAPGLEAQCALLGAMADGAILIGGGGDALAAAGCLLREGKPVVALAGSGGAAALLAGRDLGTARVFSAPAPEEAVGDLLMLLAASSTTR